VESKRISLEVQQMAEFAADLKRFSDMDDVEVAKDDPDVRGWDVTTPDGRDIGEVKDLLVDTAEMKVRALEVELDGKRFNTRDNRRVAIPVDRVQLDDDKNDVIVRGMAVDEIGRMPVYSQPPGQTIGRSGRDEMRGQAREYERGRQGEYARGAERDRLTRSEEELAVGKREVKTGEIGIGKHVETEHVSRDVPLERERVHVERRPAAERVAGSADLRDDEIRIPVHEEQAVVEKRPVVKEEVVVSKERVSEPKRVDADVRKERLDVDKEGDVRETDFRNRRER
jgi:uncharacterized protein (TIGR02271 family)